MRNYKFIQDKSELAKNPAKVGQAVFDIISKPISGHGQEVGETIDEMTPRYYKELYATIDANLSKYTETFFIVVLRKKEPWAMNVLRQWFIARKTRPAASVLRNDYPNHDHDVWKINSKDQNVQFMWTLPTAQDSASIMKSPDLYDPNLVQTIESFNSGKLL